MPLRAASGASIAWKKASRAPASEDRPHAGDEPQAVHPRIGANQGHRTITSHDIVVLGASSGGVEALRSVVSGLRPDLGAAFFITLHITPHAPDVLPQILSSAGPLPAAHAVDGERFRRGRIYIAPPDRHLLLRPDHRIYLSGGAKENGSRPAVDPMFRTAAHAFGPRVIGVVLSGALDDGTAGLLDIKSCGGVTVAQSPATARSTGMPHSAIASGAVDHTVALKDIPDLLIRLISTPVPAAAARAPLEDAEDDMARTDRSIRSEQQTPGIPSDYSCPDCGGVLRLLETGTTSLHFRCQVGHAWTSGSLLAKQLERIEDSLWAALRALEEHGKLTRRVRDQFARHGLPEMVTRLDKKLDEADRHARRIRELIEGKIEDPALAEDGA